MDKDIFTFLCESIERSYEGKFIGEQSELILKKQDNPNEIVNYFLNCALLELFVLYLDLLSALYKNGTVYISKKDFVKLIKLILKYAPLYFDEAKKEIKSRQKDKS